MARMKLCSACNQHNALDEMFCRHCGASMANASTVNSDDPPADPEPAGITPVGGDRAQPHATIRESFVLAFDWGDVPISGRLGIGRESNFSPIWRQLRPYDTVSRTHAEVMVERGTASVRHVGQNNPTFVNGRPLGTGESATLNDGDVIGFSRAVSARFTIS